ncbi:aminoglycoside 6'-N-acetyltransferase I [Mucilaginibacter frigoritolerans]|jgi:aminoglycoside 6'-N-acetyltransferase I|uniref:Aminoglycoside 6'-N-acetyltransferase I n=1 Tax=Mucilaginibacter frigoritolerans TaxID=652788 RepID=A0A562U499_9SPHI|nr:GNAT family N-acetyltransferase [Mucilaginibacter frigoritolerans]TWJ00646.1 aminoglycoside 6'-N-acetyltransferase I [Mucilaginibacter frigoritolerans]
MIVPITLENVDECVPAYIKAYNCPPWNYAWTYSKAQAYLVEYLGCQQFIGFALYDDDKLTGAVFAHVKTWWTNQQLMIDEFFVSQEKQRMGYGKKMLDYCDLYAAKYQIDSIVLMTNKYMPSYKFYNKEGYISTEQYVFMFKQIPRS